MAEHHGANPLRPLSLGGAAFHLEFPVVTRGGGARPGTHSPARAAGRPGFRARPCARRRTVHCRVACRNARRAGAPAGSLPEPGRALEILQTRPFDLVISDFRMPDMNGEHFHQALAKINPALARRVIFLTGDVVNEETQALSGHHRQSSSGQALPTGPAGSRHHRSPLRPDIRASLAESYQNVAAVYDRRIFLHGDVQLPIAFICSFTSLENVTKLVHYGDCQYARSQDQAFRAPGTGGAKRGKSHDLPAWPAGGRALRAKPRKPRNRLAVDPSLRVQLRYDPVEPLTEEEFPAQFR